MDVAERGIPYDNLKFDGKPLDVLISQLSNGKFNYPQAHLDPDLDRDRYPNRHEDWRPAFGQIDNAQSHLRKQNVGENDLFLFFGWFRRTRYVRGQLKYLQPRKGGKELHVIFGWLQVGGKPLAVNGNEIPDWLQYHPHIVNFNAGVNGYMNNNMIYMAADQLILGNKDFGVRGAGIFPCFKSSLQLTAPERTKARWCLPEWLQTGFTRPHRLNNDWRCPNNGHVPFDSGGRGQEFVFDVPEPDDPDVMKWLKGLFEGCC
jgi:hypothetical protein